MPDTTPPSPARASAEEAARLTRHATSLSVGLAVILIGLKAFAWGASGSVSLLASLMDSGLDLIASLATFFAVRWAATPPDEGHRYGRGKAEAFAGLLQAGLVFASALFVGWEAIERIITPRAVTHGGWAMAVMIISILLTLGLVMVQTRAVKRTGSIAVSADRAHYAADLGSNLVALIGVGSAALLGAAPLDAAAGLIVAVWLFWGAMGVLRDAADHLLDRALPAEDQARILELVLADPRILGAHQLRTRASGTVWMIQMHVDLDPELTLEAAHEIVVGAERRILAEHPQADIIIHPDPKGRAEPHGGAFGETAPGDETEAAPQA